MLFYLCDTWMKSLSRRLGTAGKSRVASKMVMCGSQAAYAPKAGSPVRSHSCEWNVPPSREELNS